LPSAANPLSQILGSRAAKADGCGDLLHAAHHPSINATIKLVKEGSFPLLWVLMFHAWMLTLKTTSSQIFSQRSSLHDSHALFSESIITCSFLSCNLLVFLGVLAGRKSCKVRP
jgi:hypothetical protein